MEGAVLQYGKRQCIDPVTAFKRVIRCIDAIACYVWYIVFPRMFVSSNEFGNNLVV